MKKIIVFALLLVLSLAACVPPKSGSGAAASAPPVDVGQAETLMDIKEFPLIDGSTATLPLTRALVRYFTGISADEAEILIAHSTTDDSYWNLSGGNADLIIAYEASASTKEGVPKAIFDTGKTVGRDALVFLCNKENSVEGLTTEQIQKIYTGEYTDWKAVGGKAGKIVAYQRQEDSGSQTMMLKLVMNGLQMADAPTELRPGMMSALMEAVADYKNEGGAIGYSVYYYVKNMYIVPVKILSVDGIAPTNESIKSGQYPFINEFKAYYNPDTFGKNPNTKIIYDFLTSDKGRELIEKVGYVGA
ncbi:MAG: substrate-binding domain-containing protein [Oscillospiraceae bacterium]|jgi:phosphate transport system substrate-binding protein|nr:substrate-binding domain-containing protein [Oscillospiraceae bacterium]